MCGGLWGGWVGMNDKFAIRAIKEFWSEIEPQFRSAAERISAKPYSDRVAIENVEFVQLGYLSSVATVWIRMGTSTHSFSISWKDGQITGQSEDKRYPNLASEWPPELFEDIIEHLPTPSWQIMYLSRQWDANNFDDLIEKSIERINETNSLLRIFHAQPLPESDESAAIGKRLLCKISGSDWQLTIFYPHPHTGKGSALQIVAENLPWDKDSIAIDNLNAPKMQLEAKMPEHFQFDHFTSTLVDLATKCDSRKIKRHLARMQSRQVQAQSKSSKSPIRTRKEIGLVIMAFVVFFAVVYFARN
jgi:hypothetical protein